jgi:hypothetical protein
MMQLIVSDLIVTCRHRLNAPAIAGGNQSSHIGWTHPRPRLVL